jgi:hypothetical protein
LSSSAGRRLRPAVVVRLKADATLLSNRPRQRAVDDDIVVE